jgi:hypothetical protein
MYDIQKIFTSNDISPFISTETIHYENDYIEFKNNTYMQYTFSENVDKFEIVFTFSLQNIQNYNSILCGYNGFSFTEECFQIDIIDSKLRCWWGSNIKSNVSNFTIATNIFYTCKVVQDVYKFQILINDVEIITIPVTNSYPINANIKQLCFAANIWKFDNSVYYVRYTEMKMKNVFININSYSTSQLIDYSNYWKKSYGNIDPTSISQSYFDFSIISKFSENFTNQSTVLEAISRWNDTIHNAKIPELVINFQLVDFDPSIYGDAIAGTIITNYNYGVLTDDGHSIQIPIEATVLFNSHPDSVNNWYKLNSLQKLVYNNMTKTYELKPVAYFVVLHEIGHALGIGATWSSNNKVIQSSLQNDNRMMYNGYYATLEYVKYMLDAGMDPTNIEGIPLEDDGGPGTADKHPEENEVYIYDNIQHPALHNELMTGYIGTDASTVKMSKISLGFLKDLGFNVKFDQADNFFMV